MTSEPALQELGNVMLSFARHYLVRPRRDANKDAARFRFAINSLSGTDAARVRLEIARCSLEYFIASGAPPTHDDLLERIGEGAQLLSRQQIEAMVNELVT